MCETEVFWSGANTTKGCLFGARNTRYILSIKVGACFAAVAPLQNVELSIFDSKFRLDSGVFRCTKNY